MVALVYMGILGAGGFVVYCFAQSLMLLGGLFFFIFCGMLFLLDQILEDQKQERIQKLVLSTYQRRPVQKQPLMAWQQNLTPDSFSNIDWMVGRNYQLPAFRENPGMEQFPKMRSAPNVKSLLKDLETPDRVRNVDPRQRAL